MTLVYSALALGALYALIACLFNVGMTQAGVFNFAVPQSVMLGALLTYQFAGRHGLPVLLVAAICLACGAAVGALVELVGIRPLSIGGHGALVTTVGASFLVEGLAYVVWGPDARGVQIGNWTDYHSVLGGRFAVVDLWLVISALVVAVGAYLVSTRTLLGIRGRAATADSEAAMARGINVRGRRTIVFSVVGGLGGLVGMMAAVKVYAGFDLGTALLVFSIVALTVGGMGSFAGSLLGGLLVGGIQALTARYLGDTYSLLMVFAVLLVVLFLRPRGLLGRAETRTV